VKAAPARIAIDAGRCAKHGLDRQRPWLMRHGETRRLSAHPASPPGKPES